jgi:nicotinate phosphoribosyltransferase
VAVWNRSRIEPTRWQLDWEGIRKGDYSDRYFHNGVRILQQLAQEGYQFAGYSPRLAQQGLDPQLPELIGDMRVEMQFFRATKAVYRRGRHRRGAGSSAKRDWIL